MLRITHYLLLIAYGNPLRRDDGAGLRLAERMAARWQATGTRLRHLAVQQLTPELAIELAEPGVRAVVFVDTRAVDGATAGHEPAARAVLATPLAAPEAPSPSLGHHLGPEVLLAYAALLLDDRPAPPAWLVTAPGVDFGHGERLSPPASAAIETAFDDPSQTLPRLMAELTER